MRFSKFYDLGLVMQILTSDSSGSYKLRIVHILFLGIMGKKEMTLPLPSKKFPKILSILSVALINLV